MVWNEHVSTHQHQQQGNEDHEQVVAEVKVHNHGSIVWILGTACNEQILGVLCALGNDSIGQAVWKNVHQHQDKVHKKNNQQGNEQLPIVHTWRLLAIVDVQPKVADCLCQERSTDRISGDWTCHVDTQQ